MRCVTCISIVNILEVEPIYQTGRKEGKENVFSKFVMYMNLTL